jgi:hypothetical protein
MLTKHIALLAASTLIFSACQSDDADVPTGSTQGSLSGITHVPMGQAEIHEARGQLFATNMRTLEDGVRSMFQPILTWEAELDWADDTTAIRLNAINSRLSGEDTITRLALDRVDSDQWELSAGFVSPTYRINVYDRDRLVGTLRLDEGQPVPNLLIVFPFKWKWWQKLFNSIRSNARGVPTTTQQCGFELASPNGVEVVQGDTVLRGDRVEIIEDPHESYGGADEMQVLGNGNVTYLSEKVVPE